MFFGNIRSRSDEEVLTMIQLGNRAALSELYHRYSTPLLRYFHRMLRKDHDKAQDFVQDLFVKIIQHQDAIDASMRFKTWMYSVANNMCKNEYRKQAFRNSIHLTKGNEIIRDRVIEPMATSDFAWSLEKAIEELDDDDQHLFTLRFELDLPVDEIAEVLGCPEGTVKSRVFNLKRKLAVQLSELNPLAKTI